MKRVTGIGGIFFKARDPKALLEWYRRHLGINAESWGGATFPWQDADGSGKEGFTVWTIFPASSKYFDPSHSPFMVNYRVPDLRALLDVLRSEGCTVDEKIDSSEFGDFGWVMDPEGNRIELWQPPAEKSPG